MFTLKANEYRLPRHKNDQNRIDLEKKIVLIDPRYVCVRASKSDLCLNQMERSNIVMLFFHNNLRNVSTKSGSCCLIF